MISSDSEIRERIGDYRSPYRYAFMFQYLCASRLAETIGRWAITTDHIGEDEHDGEDAVVFTLQTAKRLGKHRPIAIPLNPLYEPFGRPLLDYFKKRSGRVFRFSHQTLIRHAKNCFDGLDYDIETYKVKKDGELQVVPEHKRGFRTHALRHERAKELINFYQFTPVQLATFMGWKLSRALNGSSMMDRYISLQWRDYFPKLLKPRHNMG